MSNMPKNNSSIESPGGYEWKPLSEQTWKPLDHLMCFYWLIKPLMHNIGAKIDLNFAVDLILFERAINDFLKANPIFFLKAARFSMYYKINPFTSVKLNFIDLESFSNQKKYVDDKYIAFLKKKFDLSCPPLVRIELYRMEENRFVFLFCFPHFIGDYACLEIALKDILENYFSLIEGKQSIPYNPARDYLVQAPFLDAQLEKSLEKEKETSIKKPVEFEFLHFKKRDQKQHLPEHMNSFTLSKELAEKIRNFCTNNHLSKSLFLSGIAALSMALITDQKKFNALWLQHGRKDAALKNMFGPLAKSVCYSLKYNDQENVLDFLTNLQTNYFDNSSFFWVFKLAAFYQYKIDSDRFYKRLVRWIAKNIFRFILPKAYHKFSLDVYSNLITTQLFPIEEQNGLPIFINVYTAFNFSFHGAYLDGFKNREYMFKAQDFYDLCYIYIFRLPDDTYQFLMWGKLNNKMENKILNNIKLLIEAVLNDKNTSIGLLKETLNLTR